MTDTLSQPEVSKDVLAERVAKLERQVKRLRRKQRQSEAEILVNWTPELEAELDRRIADVKANPGQGMTLDEYKAILREKYGESWLDD